jgi:hypothetical protein
MATPDDFPGDVGRNDPADDFVAVTPSNSVDLAFRCRGIYVGGAGDLAVMAKDGVTAVTFKGVPAGTLLPIRTKRVMVTNTTATLIVALR